jgi:UDP-MurNAc hydroxylase
MLIEFVGHSSLVLRQSEINMICDPWLTGTAFDDAWALLSEPKFKAEDFSSITHIWFSHEHPDHFSPRSLALIPEADRARITVLFHESEDKKIVDYCRKMGFGQVQELPLNQWVSLAPGFDILCNTWEDTDDSWLLVKTPEQRILNINDCQVSSLEQAEALRAQTGDVDVLLTQFSISAWDGNPEDLERRQRGARAMLDRVVLQTKALNARHVIPFASFIWFCHEENDYMNECLVEPGVLVELLARETSAAPVILYPGDLWEPGNAIDSGPAVARYRADLADLANRARFKSESVAFNDLCAAAEKFSARLRHGVSPLRLWLRGVKSNLRYLIRALRNQTPSQQLSWLTHLATLRTRPARIWLTDHRVGLEFSLHQNLRQTDRRREDCDIELTSAALYYALRFLWGGESLQVNGRFREIYPDGRMPLFDYLHLACAMNHEDGAAARPL